MNQPKLSRLALPTLAAITIALSTHFGFAQVGSGAPATVVPGTGGGPTITPAQTTAITSMDQAILTQKTAATAARTAFIAAAYADPRNDTNLKEKLALLNSAELALANARSDQFMELQAGADKLGADQVTLLMSWGVRAVLGGGGGNQERPIITQFDADKDGRLNAVERVRAVEFIKSSAGGQGGQGGRGGGGGRGGNRPPASPGVKLTPADVKNRGFWYVDQDANSYRSVFQIKSKEQPAAWTALIELARTLQQTPTEQLEAALAPMLDIDGYLRFLALDNAMVNRDGFYARGADYSLYLDPNGRFHLMFYDVNEMFSSGGGGRGGGPGDGGGTALNPLAAQSDASKPIISQILAVPSLRAKYLGVVREIAEKSFDWKALGLVVKHYRDLISDDVARDTRKLFTTDQFLAGTADELSPGSLRHFFDQRRAFLLNWSESGERGTTP